MITFLAPLLCLAPAPALAPQAIVGPATPIPGTPLRGFRRPYVTWVTGELGATDVLFEVSFLPSVAGSARAEVLLSEPRGALDGIDFVPGVFEVVVGMPTGILSHYDLATGATLPDVIPDTEAIAVPPATPGTHPSTVWSTPGHVYYVENSLRIAGVLADGADDGDARVLFSMPGAVHFDDLTPIVRP